jgi:hypothetical protein
LDAAFAICIGILLRTWVLGDARGVGLTFDRYRDVMREDLLQAPSMRVERAYRKFAS